MTHGSWGHKRKMGCATRPTETIAVTDKKGAGCACAYKKIKIKIAEKKGKTIEMT